MQDVTRQTAFAPQIGVLLFICFPSKAEALVRILHVLIQEMHWDHFPMMNLTCSISYVHDEATIVRRIAELFHCETQSV